MVHVLNCGLTAELQDTYQNLELQPVQGIRVEFVLARFALAILTDVAFFVKQRLPRSLIILGQDIVAKAARLVDVFEFASV